MTVTTPVQTHNVNFDGLGFKPGTVDHFLRFDATYDGHGHYYRANCSCGFPLHYQLRNNGLAGSRALLSWRNHLETIEADPTEILLVGSVTTKTTYYELLVAPSTYVGLAPYIQETKSGRMRYWLDRHAKNVPVWMVLRRTRSMRANKVGRTLGDWRYDVAAAWSPSKPHALDVANKMLLKADTSGHTVSGSTPVTEGLPPVAMTATFSPADLIERAIAAAESKDAEHVLRTLAEIDSLMDALPIIEALRTRLRDSLRRGTP
jgi:hypothetical protein